MKILYLNINNTNNKMLEVGKVEKCDTVKLEITLLENVDYSNSEFRLLGKKADKNKIEQKDNYSLEGNKLVFNLNKQFLNCPGIVKMELNIVDDKEEYTTTLFYIVVSNTLNSEIIESIEDVQTLKDLENYLQNANDIVESTNKVVEELEAANEIIGPNEEARISNELVRNQDESLRSEAEKARLLGESLRSEAEISRNEAEQDRLEQENIRKANELARKTSENLRISREDSREQAEILRQEVFEKNEAVRNENENTRISFEDTRKLNEVARLSAENDRILQEKNRQEKELERCSFENARNEAEKERQRQEENREQHYKDFDDAEALRLEQENARINAEALREEAESHRNNLYETAETNRNNLFTTAEQNRTRIYNVAENARNEAEKQRQIEEEKRKVNEESRLSTQTNIENAENARVNAEALRFEAERNREIKEQERQDYIENTVKPKVAEINEFDIKLTKKIEKVYETINDGSFIPFDGKDITVDNSKEGYTKDTIIKGQTYQNLVKTFNGDYVSTGAANSINTERKLIYGLKPSTVYTRIIEVKQCNPASFRMYDSINDNDEKQTYRQYPYAITKGIVANTFTTSSKGTINKYAITPDYNVAIQDDFNLVIGKIVILEGDWTNKEVPSSITGIESVGEKEGNKISILSHNKNLFNKDKYVKGVENKQYYSINDKGNIVINALDSRSSTGYLDGCFMLKPNTNYTLSCSLPSNKLRVLVMNTINDWSNVTPPQDGVFNSGINGVVLIKFIGDNGNYPLEVSKIQLEEGIQATEYIALKEDKKEILTGLDGGLKSLPNGTRDTVEERADGFYLVQRVGKKVIDRNTTGLRLNGSFDNHAQFTIVLEGIKPGAMQNVNLICNTKPVKAENSGNNSVWIYGNSMIVFQMTKEVNTIELFKQWLDNNPTFIYFELATPIETKLDIDTINLETFKDATYVTSGNSIKPTLSFKAPVDVPATISSLRIKNNNLEKENKELKEDVEVKTTYLHEQDMEIVNSNLDLDFRLFEIEMLIDDSVNMNSTRTIKGVNNMARTPFEMMKILILNNNYDREDIEYKASKYLKGNRITQDQYDELISLMDANEIVK